MKIENENDYKHLLKLLKENSSGEEFISFQKRIIKTGKEIIGVKAPKLRKIAKEISECPHYELLKTREKLSFEETLVRGFVVASYRDFERGTKELMRLLPFFDNWAEVDMICSSVKFLKPGEEKCFNFLCSLLKSEQEFTCRFGIIGLMKFFIGENNYTRALDALEKVKCDKYYVNMGIAWLISEVLVKNPQNAVEIMQNIIKNRHFNCFIINKSIQKARESFRIDANTKQILNGLKI